MTTDAKIVATVRGRERAAVVVDVFPGSHNPCFVVVLECSDGYLCKVDDNVASWIHGSLAKATGAALKYDRRFRSRDNARRAARRRVGEPFRLPPKQAPVDPVVASPLDIVGGMTIGVVEVSKSNDHAGDGARHLLDAGIPARSMFMRDGTPTIVVAAADLARARDLLGVK